MAFSPNYDKAVVTAYVDGAQYGDALPLARVTLLGVAQGMIQAKVYAPVLIDDDDDENDPAAPRRWGEVDSISEGKVTERRGGGITLIGVSEMLVDQAGLTVDKASIRYDIVPKGCVSCR